MGKHVYESELQRTMSRPDAAEIEQLVDIYFGYCRDRSDSYFEQHSEVMRAWNDLPLVDPEKALAAVMIAASRYDDIGFQCQVAVGLREDLLSKPSDEIVERIVNEARKTARFRWMLSGVYKQAMSPMALKAIEPLIAGRTADDPLPPRPYV